MENNVNTFVRACVRACVRARGRACVSANVWAVDILSSHEQNIVIIIGNTARPRCV